jgi:glycosyltransferase involved in cell wall biosynthesis
MTELALHLPADLEVELWSGGPPPGNVKRATRCLHALDRNARLLKPLNWPRRYVVEQLSVLPLALYWLGRRRMDVAYCGDPALSWHLKRFAAWHRAKVVFMNGMRLSPAWARHFDGVQLLAPAYLEAARRQLPPQDLERFFVVPHFVDVELFRPGEAYQKALARATFGLSDDDFVILNVGPVGQVSAKRLEHLIGEAALLPPDSVLVSAGVDEDGAAAVRAEGRRLLGGRARFLGPIERARMPLLYRAADVFAIAALNEPFSIAILEALASGIPVVYHPDEVRTWLVGSGGLPADMTVPGAAATVFRELEARLAWRQELGRQGRSLAETRYAPGPNCRLLAEALRRVGRPCAASWPMGLGPRVG